MKRITDWCKNNKKTFYSIIAAFMIVVILVVTLYSCDSSKNKNNKSSTQSYEITNIPNEDNTDRNSSSNNNIPGNNETKNNESNLPEEINKNIEKGTTEDIYSILCSTIDYKLSSVGFTTGIGVAQNKSDEEVLGIYYYNDSVQFFKDENYKAVGFIEIDKEGSVPLTVKDDEVIIVKDVENTDDDINLVCTYNYEEIGSSHFVYKNQYVKYTQRGPSQVVYSTMDNVESNYDLSLGSLYDYDNKQYIYDESIFGEYVTHSAVSLGSEADYEELEKELKRISDEQLKAGYEVTDYSVIYISPENLQTWIDSQETSTFFGYDIASLTAEFGEGTALEYKPDKGFVEAAIEQSKEYDWKKFIAKVSAGCGIIIVCATLAPITGGTSFSAALVFITKTTVVASFSTALCATAIGTAKELHNGRSLKEALLLTKNKALDTFADTFIITAAISGACVASGLIVPMNGIGSSEKTGSIAYQRRKAVKEAWKKEVEAVKNGTSKYNWSPSEIAELLKNGKIKGYDGAHIIDVHQLKDTISSELISDPDNILFFTRKNHLRIHMGNWKNDTNTDVILDFYPWASDQIDKVKAVKGLVG